MRTERFKGGLLSALIVASLMSPLLLISAKAAWGKEIGWIKQFGTSDDDEAYGVAVDTSGNAYVAGWTGGVLPGQSSSGPWDAFLVKFGEAEPTPSTPTDYTPYLVGGAVVIVIIGIIVALYMRRRKPRELTFGS